MINIFKLSFSEIIECIGKSFLLAFKNIHIFLIVNFFAILIFFLFSIGITLPISYVSNKGIAAAIACAMFCFAIPFFFVLQFLIVSPKHQNSELSRYSNFLNRLTDPILLRDTAIFGIVYAFFGMLFFFITMQAFGGYSKFMNKLQSQAGVGSFEQIYSQSPNLSAKQIMLAISRDRASRRLTADMISESDMKNLLVVNIVLIISTLIYYLLMFWSLFSLKLLVDYDVPLVKSLRESLMGMFENIFGIIVVHIAYALIYFPISLLCLLLPTSPLVLFVIGLVLVTLLYYAQYFSLFYLVADKMLEVEEEG